MLSPQATGPFVILSPHSNKTFIGHLGLGLRLVPYIALPMAKADRTEEDVVRYLHDTMTTPSPPRVARWQRSRGSESDRREVVVVKW